jgi:hypothetical protein
MNRKLRLWATIAVTAAALLLARGVGAQEHPEHPAEHPEHPKDEGKKTALTMAELADAIRDYVARDSEIKGGMFLVFDPVDTQVLQLTLAKVHEDKLASLGEGVFFACADFNSTDKHVYDLDIFMAQQEDGSLMTTEVSVHKLDGKARYTWFEEEGIWKKKPVDGK